MKKLSLAVLFIVFICSSFNGVKAQKGYKFGHIDAQALLNIMPERDSAELALQKTAKQLEDELGSMNDELEKKYQDFMQKEATLTPLLKATKQQQLADMQQRIEEFKMTAQQELKMEENKLMQPIIEKAKNGIEEVGKENNFIYIFDISPGVVLYNSPESVDVMPMVKAKLGLE